MLERIVQSKLWDRGGDVTNPVFGCVQTGGQSDPACALSTNVSESKMSRYLQGGRWTSVDANTEEVSRDKDALRIDESHSAGISWIIVDPMRSCRWGKIIGRDQEEWWNETEEGMKGNRQDSMVAERVVGPKYLKSTKRCRWGVRKKELKMLVQFYSGQSRLDLSETKVILTSKITHVGRCDDNM